MDNLLRLLEIIERCENKQLKRVLWNDFASESQSHNEYAALARSLSEHAGRKLGYL